MKSEFLKAFAMLCLFVGLIVFNQWVGYQPALGNLYVIVVTALLSIILEIWKEKRKEPVIIADDLLIHENNILRKKLENLKMENSLLESKLLVAQSKKQLNQLAKQK